MSVVKLKQRKLVNRIFPAVLFHLLVFSLRRWLIPLLVVLSITFTTHLFSHETKVKLTTASDVTHTVETTKKTLKSPLTHLQ